MTLPNNAVGLARSKLLLALVADDELRPHLLVLIRELDRVSADNRHLRDEKRLVWDTINRPDPIAVRVARGIRRLLRGKHGR